MATYTGLSSAQRAAGKDAVLLQRSFRVTTTTIEGTPSMNAYRAPLAIGLLERRGTPVVTKFLQKSVHTAIEGFEKVKNLKLFQATKRIKSTTPEGPCNIEFDSLHGPIVIEASVWSYGGSKQWRKTIEDLKRAPTRHVKVNENNGSVTVRKITLHAPPPKKW